MKNRSSVTRVFAAFLALLCGGAVFSGAGLQSGPAPQPATPSPQSSRFVPAALATQTLLSANYTKLPLSFEENRGQSVRATRR